MVARVKAILITTVVVMSLAAPFATTAPAVFAADTVATIDSPTHEQVIPEGEVELAGIATHDSGILDIQMAVRDRSTLDWLQADGSWASGYVRLPAQFDPTGADPTWTFGVDLAPGLYGASLIVTASDGSIAPVNERPWRRFGVEAIGTEEPSKITLPIRRSHVEAGQVPTEGRAYAPAGIQQIRIAVRDRTQKLWLQATGTWGPNLVEFPVQQTLQSPTTADWTANVDLPDEGDYAIALFVTDVNGIRAPAEGDTWTIFTVDDVIEPPVDDKNPLTQISEPYRYQMFDQQNLHFYGTANDNVEVAEVTISVRDIWTGKWIQHNGQFQTPQAVISLPLVGEHDTTKAWEFDMFVPDTSRFEAIITSIDTSGNKDKRFQRFDVTLEPSNGSAPHYTSILMSRSQWIDAPQCTATPGAKTLFDVADALQARGMAATNSIVQGRPDETERTCHSNFQINASWLDIATLRDTYGWSTIAHFKPPPGAPEDASITELNYEQQVEASCGALDELLTRGYPTSWGMFAYDGNDSTPEIQADPVSNCFAFGRRYGSGVGTYEDEIAAPWFVEVASVNGGYCGDPNLDCFDVAVNRDRHQYQTPDELIKRLDPIPGSWTNFQFYRFVEGVDLTGSGTQYNCEGPTESHFTSRTEVYCWVDFLAVVDAIDGATTVTDAATVAEAWGRGNPNDAATPS